MASALPLLLVLLVFFSQLAIPAARPAAESSSHLVTIRPSNSLVHQLCHHEPESGSRGTPAAIEGFKAGGRFTFFPGQPRWIRKRPILLTYSLSRTDTIDYISRDDLSAALRQAFSRWTIASTLSFIEIDDYGAADVKVGFFQGDHGDGMPFEHKTDVLGHAFEPEGGEIHLNKDVLWTVGIHGESPSFVIEFESVVMHEIGHVLGLAHSTTKNSIMYPSIRPKTRKVKLSEDDVVGIQELYKQGDDLSYMVAPPDVGIGFVRSFFVILRACLALFILSVV